nr:unnamed protein product [Callosobruchus analis]
MKCMKNFLICIVFMAQLFTDIFKGVEMAINQKNLRWKNLKCITTDGGKNMSGKDKGVAALVSKAVENDGGSKPLVLHCINHQQSLCGKCLDISEVLKPVMSYQLLILSDLLG